MPWLFLLLALAAFAVAFSTTSMALAVLCLLAAGVRGQEVQSVSNRPVLGNAATPYLLYDAPAAVTNVEISGTWNAWKTRVPLARNTNGLWELDVRTLGARLGRHEFKFIADDVWENGDNRIMPINLDGIIERPPAMIQRAVVDDFKMIRVFFRQSLPLK